MEYMNHRLNCIDGIEVEQAMLLLTTSFITNHHTLVTDAAARVSHGFCGEASVAGVLYSPRGLMIDSWVLEVPYKKNTNALEVQGMALFAGEVWKKYKEINSLLVLNDNIGACRFLNKDLTNEGKNIVWKSEKVEGERYIKIVDELRCEFDRFQILHTLPEYTVPAHNLAATIWANRNENFNVRYPGEGADKFKSVNGTKSGQIKWKVMKELAFWDQVKKQEEWEHEQFLMTVMPAPMTPFAQANDAIALGNELLKDGKYEEALFMYESALQLAPEIPKLEPTPQAAPEIPKHEPTREAVLPKQEPAPQAAPEKPTHEYALPVSPEVKAATELRSICHSNSAACFMKLEKYDEAAKECSKALELNPVYINALSRREEAYEKLARYDEAMSDMNKILKLEPSNVQARRTIVRLEHLLENR